MKKVHKLIKIAIIAGARPNFIKIAPLIKELSKVKQFSVKLIHTGQHYDPVMSDIFFKELNIKKPAINILSGSGSHAVQTAKIMQGLEQVFIKLKPSVVIVVGDVNSTLSAAIVTSKLHIPLAHVEAGLRSGDMKMPEEVNRIVTDRLSEYLFIPSEDAYENLNNEGIERSKIFFAGNIMIDTLINNLKKIEKYKVLKKYKLTKNNYCLVTLHRPSNVDNKKMFIKISKTIRAISETVKIFFPVHPRTMINIEKFGINKILNSPDILLTKPIGYRETIALVAGSKMVITDSGGLQEESTYLRKPCLTIRPNTERPVTVTIGTNTVVGDNMKLLLNLVKDIMNNKYKAGNRPKYWDGRTSERIRKTLVKELLSKNNI
ncbi:MAG: UDP-N-acetylglucosamine 2-epimerase (non-hydrolyzing) [Ignavibacteria bacterium]|nr:UDP-N-acetylglucosamine 2-epimerase (non-hydrolyzing) [Ignavibacteria bacterium]